MDKHKISISFKADRMHIYNYLKTTDGIKDNISAYICTLIEKDMINVSSRSLEEQVRTLVSQFISNYTQDNSLSVVNSNSINDDDFNLINSLF